MTTKPPSVPFAERMVFASAVESMFIKSLGAKVTPAMRAELKTLGINLDKLDPAYPLALWMKALICVAGQVFPQKPLKESLTLLGEGLVEQFADTLLGRPMMVLVKLIGPLRTLKRMEKNFRNANNYSESELKELGPNHYELWLNEVGDTHLVSLGILRRGLEFTGVTGISVEVLSSDEQGTRYSVKL